MSRICVTFVEVLLAFYRLIRHNVVVKVDNGKINELMLIAEKIFRNENSGNLSDDMIFFKNQHIKQFKFHVNMMWQYDIQKTTS